MMDQVVIKNASQNTIQSHLKQGKIDQKIKLQQILRERYQNNGIKQKYLQNAGSNQDNDNQSTATKKLYSSQATQIQDDLFMYDKDTCLNKKRDENEDDENTSFDKSQYDPTTFMQSRYEQPVKKHDDSHYFMKNEYITNKKCISFRVDEDSQGREKGGSQKILSFTNKTLSQNFNSASRRYSHNMILNKLSSEYPYKLKLDENSTQEQQHDNKRNYFPQLRNSSNIYAKNEGSSINNSSNCKKRIQINHKEVYKLFCLKMKEEEKKKNTHREISNKNQLNAYSTLYPLQIYKTNMNQIHELSVFSQKKTSLPFHDVFHANPVNSPSVNPPNSRIQSHLVSRKPSMCLEELKADQKLWNLASISDQQNGIPALNQKGDKHTISSQIYKKYQQKLMERSDEEKAQFKLDVKRPSDVLFKKDSFSLIKRKSIQLESCESPSNILDQQQIEIQPRRLLKKFFSVKQYQQYNLSPSNRSPLNQQQQQIQQQPEVFGKILSAKQIVENTAQQRSYKKQKSNSQYQIQLPQLKQGELNKNRSNSSHNQNQKSGQKSGIESYDSSTIKYANEEVTVILEETNPCVNNKLISPRYHLNKQVIENYYS